MVAADGHVVWFRNLASAAEVGQVWSSRGPPSTSRIRGRPNSSSARTRRATARLPRLRRRARGSTTRRSRPSSTRSWLRCSATRRRSWPGRPIYAFMTREAGPAAREWLCRRRQGVIEKHDFVFLKEDGRNLWTSISATPLFDQSGAYRGALAVVTDISHQRWTDALVSAQRRIFEYPRPWGARRPDPGLERRRPRD